MTRDLRDRLGEFLLEILDNKDPDRDEAHWAEQTETVKEYYRRHSQYLLSLARSCGLKIEVSDEARPEAK